MTSNYDDIINLPHHVSETHPRISRIDRAAQFSPFSAVVGYDAAVRETARLTDRRIELDEYAKDALNEKLRLVADATEKSPEITITYFRPDSKKIGGAYVTAAGCLKKIDDYERMVYLTNGTGIAIDEILDVKSELIDEYILF